jgi:LPXTG-motif cell wall-anchored protein
MTYGGSMAARRSAHTLWIAGVLAALGSLFVATPSAAQADARRIDVWLESPPSIAPGIDLRLSRGATDITAAECGPMQTPSDSAYVQRSCADLGDGDFAVSLTGAPPDAIVSWECVDIVAAQTEHTAIPLGGGYTEWRCVATVSPPGVVIDGTYSVGGDGLPLADLDLVIEDDAGTAIGPCEVDQRGGIDRQWCGPLADGTYRAVPQDVPTGLRAAAACTDLPPTSGSRSGPFTIDATNPRWICERPVPYEPLAFEMSWSGATGRDRTWFVDAAPTVRAADGTDLTTSCTERQRAVDDPDNLFIEYACAGLAPGSYSVTFSGIPSDFAVASDCEPVVVPEQPGLDSEFCSVSVTSEPLDVPPVDPPVDEPPALPETGTASRTLLLAGFAALASGLALLAAGRRRPRPLASRRA